MHDLTVAELHNAYCVRWSPRAGGDVQAGLDDAVVAQRDPDAGVGAQQASLADRTTSLPPPERVPMIEAPPPMSVPSPTTTPAEMRPSTIDCAEGAGVEVDEALVHHGGALGEVGAEAHPVGVGDPHAGRHDVVGHPRELVEPCTGSGVPVGASAEPRPSTRSSTATGPSWVHATVGSRPKIPSRLTGVRL